MIPDHRLATLLNDLKDQWVANCRYHNSADSPSLLPDHHCNRDEFQEHGRVEHTSEVWYIQFSNDGTLLASASKNAKVYIYDTVAFSQVQSLDGHTSGVGYLAWSPDDSKLITCSSATECAARIWDVRVRALRTRLVSS